MKNKKVKKTKEKKKTNDTTSSTSTTTTSTAIPAAVVAGKSSKNVVPATTTDDSNTGNQSKVVVPSNTTGSSSSSSSSIRHTCANMYCKAEGTIPSVVYGYVCSRCIEKDVYRFISKTNVHSHYYFNDDDLAPLKIYYRETKYGTATCYYVNDLDALACKKYNIANKDDIPDTLQQIADDSAAVRAERAVIARQKRYVRQAKRKEKLVAALQAAGVPFRSDSQFSEMYIESKRGVTLDRVVRRMSEIKYLYDYCHMKEIRDTSGIRC